MQVDIGFLVGAIGTICAIVFGYVAAVHRKKADDHSDGKQDGMVLTELGYVKSGVDDIKRKQDKQGDQLLEVLTRLTSVEASTKQAHKRLDRLEGQSGG